MITVDAKTENVDAVTEYAELILDQASCPIKIKYQIDIAIDEIFSNIALYAYDEGQVGKVDFEVSVENNTATLVFSDSGTPYNPLENSEPDITLSADERKVGGLGIFMVKKSMDNVLYSYENKHNVLTLIKSW